MEKKINRMQELMELIKAENDAYYLNDSPIVSDREWDAQFDELASLRKKPASSSPAPPLKMLAAALSRA